LATFCSSVARFGNGIAAGTVEMTLVSIRYAAVAAAASFEAVGANGVPSR
jgi:hypothetical protein